MNGEFDIWIYLLQVAPALGILAYFAYFSLGKDKENITWLKNQHKIEIDRNDKLNEEIKDLNLYIRENDKENLKMLQEFSSLLERFTAVQKNSNDKIVIEIRNKADEIKNHVDSKINDLKK